MSSTENKPDNDLPEEERQEAEGAAPVPGSPVSVSNEESLSQFGGVEITYNPIPEEDIPEFAKKHMAVDDGRRLLVARNLVPMPPREMGVVLFVLMNDSKAPIRNAAEDSFDDLPPNIIRNIAGQKNPWQVLDYIARNFYEEKDPHNIIETVILNPATGVDTLLLLTRIAPGNILDLIANNQTRLQRSPQIISEFPKNSRASIAQLSRVLEFGRRQNLITVDQENMLIDEYLGRIKPQEDEAVTAEAVEKAVPEVVTEAGEADWAFPSFMTADFEADIDLDAEAAVIEDKIKSKLNLRDMIRTMSVPQKMRLAVRGNMEARNVLIMDSLALVAKEVLKSPRLTKTEVERAAESRLVDPEILELISKNASFTRTYAVRYALVTNPKTPLQFANRLLGTLMEKDIKVISKSRSVPQAVQNIARQKIDAQEQRRKKREKKKK